MGLYEIELNGIKFTFNVVNNFTEPCPQCGVPACGREDVIWYEKNGLKLSIIFDGGYFDLACQDVITMNLDLLQNNELPMFLKEYNDHNGWVDSNDCFGYNLDANDFLKSMELFQNPKLEKWISKDETQALMELAKEALSHKQALKILRG